MALLLPTVSVGLPPATVSTVPLPERLLTMRLIVFRSRAPLALSATAEPVGRPEADPSCKTPLLTVVPPPKLLLPESVSVPAPSFINSRRCRLSWRRS